MGLWIGIILAAILIVLLVLSKRSKATTEKRPTVTSVADTTTTSKFHAVSIQVPNSACDAAKSIEGKRFLSSAAPRIPLAECDVPACKCRFIHHADRRSGVDRRGQVPQNALAHTGGYSGRERRYRGDRRGSGEPQNFFA